MDNETDKVPVRKLKKTNLIQYIQIHWLCIHMRGYTSRERDATATGMAEEIRIVNPATGELQLIYSKIDKQPDPFVLLLVKSQAEVRTTE